MNLENVRKSFAAIATANAKYMITAWAMYAGAIAFLIFVFLHKGHH